MRLYENEAKKIFSEEGIPVPKQIGLVCEAEQVKSLEGIEFPCMLKSLVLIGGRGKAGGIQKAKSVDEAVQLAGDMLGKEIRGYTVDMLMVEKAEEDLGACYVGVTMNPSTYNNIIMVSPSGGVDIETVAKENPEAILKIELTENEKILPDDIADKLALILADGLETGSQHVDALKDVITKVYETFQKCFLIILDVVTECFSIHC